MWSLPEVREYIADQERDVKQQRPLDFRGRPLNQKGRFESIWMLTILT
jgi:hypothetical protein